MRVDMVPGHSYDLVSSEEMHGHMAGITAKMQEFIRQEVLGVKPVRFQSNVLVPGAAPAYVTADASPQQGYIWSVTSLLLATNANATINATWFRTQDPGNLAPLVGGQPDPSTLRYLIDKQFSTTLLAMQKYGTGQLLVQPGEQIVCGVSGAGVVAGINFQVLGQAIEVPAEMIGKLLL